MFDIAGNEELISRLEKAVAADSLSHFYMICGPEGSGRSTLAHQLAAAMECVGADPPCCQCPQCRKVLGRIHPDVTVISSDRQTIGVEPIRQMRTDAYIRPNEGKRRVFIIPNAETLTVQAQNVMLKLLEEPPGTASFMLLTSNPGALLQTVRSRAVELSMSRLTGRQVMDWLQERFPGRSEDIRRAAELCQGLLGKALELMESDSQQSAASGTAQAVAAAISSGSPLELAAAITSLERSSRTDFEQFLSGLYQLLADLSAQSSRYIPIADAVSHATELFRANVSTAHICGYLTAAITQLL